MLPHQRGLAKTQEEAKKWFDRYGLDAYLTALCTELVTKKPNDPNMFFLQHLVKHTSAEQLESAGLMEFVRPQTDAGNK